MNAPESGIECCPFCDGTGAHPGQEDVFFRLFIRLAEARQKHFGLQPKLVSLVALMEEVGEIARASLAGDSEAMEDEALDAAAVALRIADEGREFGCKP